MGNNIGFDVSFGFGSNGGGSQSLDQVLAISDRSKRDVNEAYVLEAINDTEVLWLQNADANLELFADTFVKENAEVIIIPIAFNNTLTVENVEVLFEGSVFDNSNPIITLPFSSLFSLRLISENRFFLSVEKLAATPPLNEVLSVGNRLPFTSFPMAIGAFDLLPQHKSEFISLTDTTADESKIIWVSTDCSEYGAEYKIFNGSQYSFELRAKDGVTLLGDNLFIIKNSTCTIKALQLEIEGSIKDENVFSVTYEYSFPQDLEELIYVARVSQAGTAIPNALFEKSKLTEPVTYDFNGGVGGRFKLISLNQFIGATYRVEFISQVGTREVYFAGISADEITFTNVTKANIITLDMLVDIKIFRLN